MTARRTRDLLSRRRDLGEPLRGERHRAPLAGRDQDEPDEIEGEPEPERRPAGESLLDREVRGEAAAPEAGEDVQARQEVAGGELPLRVRILLKQRGARLDLRRYRIESACALQSPVLLETRP